MDREDRSGSDEDGPTETEERDPTEMDEDELVEATGSSPDGTAADETETAGDETEESSGSSESEDGFDRTDDESLTRADERVPPNRNVSSGTDTDEGLEDESDGSGTGTDDATGVDNDDGTGIDDDAIAAGSVAPEDIDGETRVSDTEDTENDEEAGVDEGTGSDEGTGNESGLVHRFRHDMDGPLMWMREMLSSVAIVLLIGLILFGVSGVWPPMVAVESGSMEPNMEVGDLVFVTEPGRFAPDTADNDVGVVTHETGQEVDYRSFNDYGSVVIFQPPGRQSSPIIHRAMFHVEEGENWYDRADERYHGANDCEELRHCPAPRDGFITLGDDNREYDQANGLAEPVAEEWVTGVARLRVPYLGYVRLITTGQAEIGDLFGMTTPTVEPENGAI